MSAEQLSTYMSPSLKYLELRKKKEFELEKRTKNVHLHLDGADLSPIFISVSRHQWASWRGPCQ